MNKLARFLISLLVLAMLAGCGAPATPVPSTSVPPAAPTTAPAQPTVAPTAPPPTKAPTPTPKPKAVTVMRGPNDPKSIDPQRAVDARDMELSMQLLPGLVLPNTETNEIMPGMAKSWEISPDGLVYTFHLLEKVPWVRYNPDTKAVEQVKDKDGNVRYVTAKDFVYAYLRAINPETGANQGYQLAAYIVGGSDYNNKKGPADKVAIKAVDDYTFQVTTPEKVGYTLGIFATIHARAVPQWDIEANGDAWTDPKNVNTFGPLALKEWVHESSMTMVKNPFWPGSKGIQPAKLDQVTIRFIDLPTGLTEFEAGNMDVTQIASDQVVRVKADPKLGPQLKIVPGQCTQAWGFNVNKAPFNNVHIRRAFNFAVDRVSLVKDVLGGGEIPAIFFTPPSISLAPSALPEYADLGAKMFDPEKAKQELALGLKDLGLASADKLPSITVEHGTSAQLSAVAQALQAMWQKTLGVKVQLSQIDNKVYWGKQGKDAGQIHRAGWCPDYNDTNNYLLDVYRSDSGNNFGKWTNPQFDKLVDQARVETDLATRLKLYTQAEQILNIEDAGTMTLYYPVTAWLTKSNIKRTYTILGNDYYWDWDITP